MRQAMFIALLTATTSLLSSISFAEDFCDLFHGETNQAWVCRVVDFNGRRYVSTGSDPRDACAKAALDCVEYSVERNCTVESYHHRRARHRD